MLSKTFEIKDLGEASFILGIEIHRDRSRGLLRLYQKAYISYVLKRFVWMAVHPVVLLLLKEVKFLILVSIE